MGRPILPEGREADEKILRREEYRRCNSNDPDAAMRDDHCHVLAAKDSVNDPDAAHRAACDAAYVCGFANGWAAAVDYVSDTATPAGCQPSTGLDSSIRPSLDGLEGISSMAPFNNAVTDSNLERTQPRQSDDKPSTQLSTTDLSGSTLEDRATPKAVDNDLP